MTAAGENVAGRTHVDTENHTDIDIARAVGKALQFAADVPATVEVAVSGRVVTLSGSVSCPYQRDAASRAVQGIEGVRHVVNIVTLGPSVMTVDIKAAVEEVLAHNALLDGGHIAVTSETGGLVTLTGIVRSWALRGEVERACWSVSGVIRLDDHLRVGYQRGQTLSAARA